MMRTRWLASLVLGAATVACGGGREQAPSATPTPAAAAATTPAPTLTPQLAPAKVPEPLPLVTPVAFEQLAAFLPTVEGWTRGGLRGENVSVGLEMARAEAKYESGDVTIDLEIIDSGHNPLVLIPRTMFMGPRYAERSAEGYRQAIAIAGVAAYEGWDAESRQAEVAAVAGKRYVVVATAHNVDNPDAARALVTAVNLVGLATLK
jgi:hypothetical protein